MTKRTASTRRSRRVGAVAIFLAAGVGLIEGCRHEAAQEPPKTARVQPLKCDEWLDAQEPLAELGLQALRVFGRIDPGLYIKDERTGKLSLNGSVVPKGGNAEDFTKALDLVNSKYQRALALGYEAAVRACAGDGCPAHAYDVSVVKKEIVRGKTGEGPIPPGVEAFSWNVTSATAPSLADWRRSYLAVYSSPPEYCATLPSIIIENDRSGFALIEGLTTQRTTMTFWGCPCWYGHDGQYDSQNRCTVPC